MTGLLFARPEWLAPGLVCVAALGIALVWAGARTRRDLRTLLGEAVHTPAQQRRGLVRTGRDAALILALLLILLGLLGPRLGRENVQLSTSGVDLVVALDSSRSMDAPDVPPSRLEAARRVALALLAGLGSGDRAALAVFAGRGVLLTPLTSDHAALAEMITAIDTTLVKPGGSDLPSGILSSLSAFEPADERPRAIFLLTDGEAQGRPIDDGLVAAVRASVRIFPVAFGTPEGTTIPDHGVPLRDSEGEIVTSRRRLSSLEKAAKTTGGILFITDEWGWLEMDAVLRELHAPVASAPGEFVEHPVTVAVVVPFAVTALLLLWLDWLAGGSSAAPKGVRNFARSPTSRRPGPLAAVALCAVSLAATAQPPSEVPVPTAGTLLAAGLDHAARGSWRRARTSFLNAALATQDPGLRAIAYHDLGVAALRQRDLEAARDAFFDALAATGGEGGNTIRVARTQWNLEWVLQRLAAKPPPEPAPSEPERGGQPEKKEQPPQAEASEERPAPTPEKPMPFENNQGHRPRQSRPLPEAHLELDADERKSWLSRIQDDPRRALLSATFEPHQDRRRRRLGRPTW